MYISMKSVELGSSNCNSAAGSVIEHPAINPMTTVVSKAVYLINEDTDTDMLSGFAPGLNVITPGTRILYVAFVEACSTTS
jgi:hypothetical protein